MTLLRLPVRLFCGLVVEQMRGVYGEEPVDTLLTDLGRDRDRERELATAAADRFFATAPWHQGKAG